MSHFFRTFNPALARENPHIPKKLACAKKTGRHQTLDQLSRSQSPALSRRQTPYLHTLSKHREPRGHLNSLHSLRAPPLRVCRPWALEHHQRNRDYSDGNSVARFVPASFTALVTAATAGTSQSSRSVASGCSRRIQRRRRRADENVGTVAGGIRRHATRTGARHNICAPARECCCV